jgi:beta-1,4-mannosyl-glycoprotein beta-1,4-N-acetylglucosaminyltransferase
MTSKYPLNLSSPARRRPHNVYYMIETTALSLESLEIQIMEVVDLVNLFILCDLVDSSSSNSHHSSNSSSNRGRKRLLLSPLIIGDDDNANDRLFRHHRDTGFLKTIRHQLVLVNDTKCTPRNVYQKFRQLLHPNDFCKEDILIFSKSEEILNRRAINYFRWYDNWPQPVRLRLKWLVYGFFWQHPESTAIGSVVSQLGILEEVYKSDPARMLDAKPAILVGDLNHYGGWYCQYCAQILDIIKKLQFDKRSIATASYQLTVNTEYIQNLIATGLNIDGKQGLVKLRRYSDKYYSPEYVTKYSWKFDNIVINLFAKWEEDDYENSWK